MNTATMSAEGDTDVAVTSLADDSPPDDNLPPDPAHEVSTGPPDVEEHCSFRPENGQLESAADPDTPLSLYELIRTDFIRCAQCTEVYTYPCILPCLHSLCGSCIDKLQQETGQGEQKEVVVTCPVCHSVCDVPIGGFPCNHFLCNLVEIYDTQQEDEIPCTYCQYEFEENAATSRCIQCQDNLCQNCAAAHKKTKITRSHILAPFEQIKLGKYDADMRNVQRVNCNKHPLQACTKYCYSCQLLVCVECKEHKKHKVTSVGNKSLTELELVKDLSDTLNLVLPVHMSRQQLLQGHTSRLEQNHELVVKSINDQTDLLHELVESRKNTVLEELQSQVSRASESVVQELSSVDHVTDSLSSNLQLMECLLQYSKPEELIDLQTVISRRLDAVNCYVPQKDPEEELSISYQPGADNQHCESAINKLLGDVHLDVPLSVAALEGLHREDIQYRSEQEYGAGAGRSYPSPSYIPLLLEEPQLCVEFDSSLSSDSNNTWPTGVCTTAMGEIVVCDRDNALVKIFSSSGVYKSSFNGELDYRLIKPFDVSSLSTGEIVVTDYGSESVKVFSTSGIGRLKICGEFEYPRGVATTTEDHIVVLDSELGRVTVHSSVDGALLKIIKGHSPSTNMIDPYYICVSQHLDIIVTDFAEPNVKLLSLSGASRPKEVNYGEYGVASRQGLLQPYGCCQDGYGITMIADNRNDKINVLLPNGVFAKHLITRRHGLWQPIALCVDISGQLIVTEGLGKVKIFKYI